MTGHSKHACQLTGSAGRVCYMIKGHPGRVHVDVTDGGLVVWSLPDEQPFANRPAAPADPLQDAPRMLRTAHATYDLNAPVTRTARVPDPTVEQCGHMFWNDLARYHCTKPIGHYGSHAHRGRS